MIRIIKLGNFIYENIEPYIIDEQGNKIWIVPTDVNELKKAMIDTVKWQAKKKLAETDWVIVKCTELGLDPNTKYPDIIAQRKQIRDWSNQKETEIQAASTIDELLSMDIKIPW